MVSTMFSNPTYNSKLTPSKVPLLKTENRNTKSITADTSIMPISQFFVNPALGCTIPHNVFFVDQSTGADSWLWDFGDGSAVSTEQNPSHTYTSVGVFTVSLTAIDSGTGLFDISTDTVTVTSTNTDFNGNPVIGCGPLTVDFVDLSTVMGGNIISWLWEFGDGQTSNSQHPTHLYDIPGLYDVILTVSTDNGCMSALTRNNYVNVLGPDPDFSANPTMGNAPLTVNFMDETTYGAPAQSWLWDFGNGDTSTEENPTYIYTSGCGEFDITLTATDINGCPRSITKPAFIQLADNNLTIICPDDLEEEADENCAYLLPDYTGLAEVFGNCSPVSITQSPPGGSSIPAGTTAITLTVSDGINMASCSFNITVVDVDPPEINCGGDRIENFNEDCQFIIPDYTTGVTVFDACDTTGLIVIQNPPEGTIISSITTVTFTSFDNLGNEGTCSFDVIPNDSIAPVIFCPSDFMELTDENCEFTIPDYRPLVLATDNCGIPTLSQSPAPGSLVGTGNTQITIIASDGINNVSCNFNIIIENNNILIVNCPEEQFETADVTCSFQLPDYTNLASFEGNCGTVALTQSPMPGTIISSGTTIVSITATDGAGSKTCYFNVTVADNTPPVLNCPETQNESLNENCVFVIPDYSDLAFTNDSCGSSSISQIPVAGTIITSVGTQITLIASDGLNEATCTFEILISDTTAPTIECPENFTISANSNCLYYIPNFIPDVFVYDNCTNNPTISQDPIAGSSVGIGDTEITIFATDGVNTGSASFTVTVIDDIPPTIICPETQIGEVGQNCTYILQDYTSLAFADDGCSTPTVTQNPPAGTLLDLGSQLVTLTASDGIATTSCNFTVSIIDATPPTVNCANIVVQLDENGEYTLTPDHINAGSGDNCAISTTTIDVTTLDCSNVGSIDVTLTVTDVGGNSESCIATVTVLSNANPMAVCDDVTVVLDENGIGTLEGIDLNNGSTGGCIYSVNINTFDCDDIGTPIPVIMTLSNSDDPATSSCTAYVNVVDNIDPIINCPQETVIIAAHGPYELPDYVLNETVSYSDNCSSQGTYTQFPAQGTIIEAGETEITITVTDPSENLSTCTFTVTLDPTLNTIENIKPDIVLFPNPIKDVLHISNSQNANITGVTLYNLLGSKIKTVPMRNNNVNISIPMQDLTNAIYMLKVEIDNKSAFYYRVIKK